MDEPGDSRAKWAVVGALVVLAVAWAWVDTPVDPRSESGVVDSLLVFLVLSLPAGLTIAALCARFGPRSRTLTVTAWIAVCVYGVCLAGLAAVMSIWSGRLFYCGDPGQPSCLTGWPPRIAIAAAAAATLIACALAELYLRKRWWPPSAPS